MPKIRSSSFYCLLLILSTGLINCEVDYKPEVQSKQGVLSGKVEKTFWNEKTYFAFRGVPYAEPPVGTMRFQPPKPHNSWEGSYEAYDNKPTCKQFSSRTRNGEPTGVSGSEDCLYLSVYTPKLKGNYPVVVFDYNDNFRTGFNGSDTYSPDFFIEEDVVIVTISHRLGLLGYLTTNDDIIPANNGIRDFILGLKWVRDNIEKFGGDKTKITLMGNKGGAALANILLYSEKAKGLFSAVILQSGTALETIYFYPEPRNKAFELGKALEIETDDSRILLEELHKQDVENMLFHESMVLDNEKTIKHQIGLAFPFAPTIEEEYEDSIITTLPENAKIVNDVPVLIGSTSREGLDLASHLIFYPKFIENMLSGVSIQLPIRPGFRFDPNSTVFQRDAARDINEFYYRDGYLHIMNILEYSVYIGDTLHSYALDYTAKKLAKDLESPVFYYLFDFRGFINENSEYMSKYTKLQLKNWGATVTDELCYLHLCTRMKKTYKELKKLVTEQREIKVLKKMVRMWTNFAKTRNPTPENQDNLLQGFIWKPVDKTSLDTVYLHIDKTFKMKTNPLGKRAKFWDVFLEKYGKLALDGVVQDLPVENQIKEPFELKLDYENEDDEIERETEIHTNEVPVAENRAENDANVDKVVIVDSPHEEL